jgi:hypothetical protein
MKLTRAFTWLVFGAVCLSSFWLLSSKKGPITRVLKRENCPLFISVVIVSSNSATFLNECVESVLRQTWARFEIILVDQGSVDGSVDIGNHFHRQFPGIVRFIESRFSGTPSTARNLGISIAGGDYIVPLDGDDVLAPTALADYAAQMCRDADLDAVVGYNEMFGNLTLVRELGVPIVGQCELYDSRTMFVRNQIMNTCMYRRSVWIAAGHYSELAPAAEDWYFWWTAAETAPLKVQCINKTVLRYRQTGSSRSSESMLSNGAVYAALQTMHPKPFAVGEVANAHKVLRNAKSTLLDRTIKRLIEGFPRLGIPRFWRALQYLGSGDQDGALAELRAALRLDFHSGVRWQVVLVYAELQKARGADVGKELAVLLHERGDAKNLPLFWQGRAVFVSSNMLGFAGKKRDWCFGLYRNSVAGDFLATDNSSNGVFMSSDSAYGGVVHHSGVSHPSVKHCAVQRWTQGGGIRRVGIFLTVSLWSGRGGGDGVLVYVSHYGKTIFRTSLIPSTRVYEEASIPDIAAQGHTVLDFVTCAGRTDAHDSTLWNVDIHEIEPPERPTELEETRLDALQVTISSAARSWLHLGDLVSGVDRAKAVMYLGLAFECLQYATSRKLGLPEVEAVGLGSALSHALVRLGVKCVQNGEYNRAKRMFRLSVCTSSFAYAYAGLAVTVFLQRNLAEAQSLFFHARSIKGDVTLFLESLKAGGTKDLRDAVDALRNVTQPADAVVGQAPNHDVAIECSLAAGAPWFAGKPRRRLAVVYAHMANSRLGPQGTFQVEMDMLCFGFRALGYDVLKGALRDCLDEVEARFSGCKSRQIIVLAPVFLQYEREYENRLPNGTVLVQAEQLTGENNTWITKEYMGLLRSPKYVLWDYSETNLAELQRVGVRNAKVFTYGYVPQQSMSFPGSPVKDVDVAFFGLMHPRRYEILISLQREGFSCIFLEGVYNWERDFTLARAKVIINIHYYSSRVTETNRLMISLLARGMVISESGGAAAEQRFWEDAGVVFVPFDKLVNTTVAFLRNDLLRYEHVQRGIQHLIKWSFFEKLDHLVSRSNDGCGVAGSSCVRWPL